MAGEVMEEIEFFHLRTGMFFRAKGDLWVKRSPFRATNCRNLTTKTIERETLVTKADS